MKEGVENIIVKKDLLKKRWMLIQKPALTCNQSYIR